MKSTIWKKIFYLKILPFSVIYAVLSVFIVYQVYQTQTRKVKEHLHSMTLYNEVNIKSACETLELSVQVASSELGKINPADPAARETGEVIITSRFYNSRLVNAWLAFERNAFDRKDSLYAADYSGVPSGRYIRSFLRDGEAWKPDPSIDESAISNSSRYIKPRQTQGIYSSLGSQVHDLPRDYGFGPGNTISVSAPVWRNNAVIGVVGFDMDISNIIHGSPLYKDSCSAIFLLNGTLSFFPDTSLIGKTLEELDFPDCDQIMESMERLEEVYLNNGCLGINGAMGYSLFCPVRVQDKYIYIYTSVPKSSLWLETVPVLLLIGVSLFISLGVFFLLFIYLSKGVANPLKKLARSSESLASGNLDVQIDVVHSGDEIEMITRSLDRMAEQFRVSKLIQQRYQNRFDIIMRIHNALFHAETLDGAFDEALTEIADYFHVYKASMIIMRDESPKICSVYPVVERDEGESEFFAHRQVVQLLKGRKHIFMNYGAITGAQLSFVNFETKSLCILPLRVNGILRGYIIIEGKDQESFIHDDTTLIFLGVTLSNIIGCRIDWEQMADDNSTRRAKEADIGEIQIPEDYDVFLEKAKAIQGLDVEKGILILGGEREKYSELLKITLKVINDGMKKMRDLFLEDVPAFAIEVHGMKSALYTIGADQWGDEAKQLEFAAKSGDAPYCSENYPVFEEKLRALSRNLTALFPKQDRNFQNGNFDELHKVLPKIKEAAGNFDSIKANSLLLPFIESRMADEEIQELLDGIGKDLEDLEYEAAGAKITSLQDKLDGKNQ